MGKDVKQIMKAILELCGHDTPKKGLTHWQNDKLTIPNGPLSLSSSPPIIVFGNGNGSDKDLHSYDSSKHQNRNLIHKRYKLRLEDWLKERKGFDELGDGMKEIIRMCLGMDPSKRADAETLLAHPYFYSHHERENRGRLWVRKPFLKSALLDIYDLNVILAGHTKQSEEDEVVRTQQQSDVTNTNQKVKEGLLASSQSSAELNETKLVENGPAEDPLQGEPLVQIYHFWKLAGGDLEAELAPQLQLIPPILRIPLIAPAARPSLRWSPSPLFLRDKEIVD